MPAITVAIPAYKTAHLSQAIASVLAQTFADFELLISDDSPGGEVKAVVAQFGDPRIRLIEGPRKGLVPNSVHLWENASADLLKYVYDDDFLLPFCLAELSKPMQADPELTYAFAFRYIVDDGGSIVATPQPVAKGSGTRFAAPVLPRNIITNIRNFIGEPSNILIRRSRFPDASCLNQFCGVPIRHMIDVTFYMNAGLHGPAAAVPAFHAAFRRHAQSVSSLRRSPGFSAGVYEWELFVRGAVQLGLVTPAEALQGLPTLDRAYGIFETPDFPELSHRRQQLPQLKARLEAGERQLVDDAYLAEWRWADGLIRQRLGEAPLPA
jgi:glycosyltransferase involved in cell wall biosynthesis